MPNQAERTAEAARAAGSPRHHRSLGLLVVVLFAAAALCVLFRAELQTGDSLAYARSIRSGTGLFHPHHLLFNPIIRGVWLGLKAAAPSVDPLLSAQAHNIFWALVVLASVFIMVRRMTSSPGLAALFSAALFFCLGFWQYATFVEVYVPTMGCLTLLLVLLQPVRPALLRPGRLFALLALFCLAILYNQISVLFAVPLAALLARRFGRRGWVKAAGFLAVSGAVVLASYLAAYAAIGQAGTAAGFVRWCLSYAFYPDPRWGTVSNFSLLGGAKLLLSIARNFVFIPPSFFVPAALLTGLALAALVFFTLRAIFRRAPEAEFRLALLLWLGIMVLFIWWFTPYGYELYIPLLPLYFLLLARLAADRRAASGTGPVRARPFFVGLAGAIVIGAAVWNLWDAVLPAHAGRGPDYDRAARIQSFAPAEAVLIADFELRENLLYYFERAGVLEDGPILYSFYRHWELEPDPAFPPGRPVLVSVAFCSPESVSAKPYNADTHPAEWRTFMEWLLGCEIRDGRVVSARIPSAAPGLAGYLSLSADSGPVDGLADVLGRLDRAAAEAKSAVSAPFSSWLGRHPELVR